MPRSGGIFSLVPGYFAVDGTTIEVSQHNPPLEDIAQALTDSLPRDGSAPMTGNLAMGSNKITSLSAGTNPGDAVRLDQVPNLTGLSNGIIAKTGPGATAARTLTGGTLIAVTNGDGVAGNPNIAIAATGSAGQVIAMNDGASAPAYRHAIMQIASQASTSGTSRDFTGIPAWARRVTIIYVGVSLSGTAEALIQLGTSGGFETTNYIGASITGSGSVAIQALSSGFRVYDNAQSAANLIHGKLTLEKLEGANTWVADGHFTYGDTPEWRTVVGSKSLSGTMDRIRSTTTNGTDTHDAGTIGVIYE